MIRTTTVCIAALLLAVTAAAGESWQNERWIVEDFTWAMGGGPSWGRAEGCGTPIANMVPDQKGNLYVVAGSGWDVPGLQYVDIITPDGMRYHLAGTGKAGYRDGPASQAQFRMGVGAYYGYTNIGVDGRGNIFVPDNGNDCIRRIYKNAQGQWMVETYAGGGQKRLKDGETCAPREARIGGSLHVGVAPDGAVTIATTFMVFRVDAAGKQLKCLGRWPSSISKDGKNPKMNLCGGGVDKNGNAYFGARTPDVVCKIDSTGRISHVAGALFPSREAGWKVGDCGPLQAFFDTPSSFYVDYSGEIVYVCGGDEYDIRRVPTDEKSTTATLLMDGRWHIMNVHPNKNRGKAIFDPKATGKPRTEGGELTNLMCTPLVGIDHDGNLYGKLNSWTGMTTEIAGEGLLGTRVFRIRKAK